VCALLVATCAQARNHPKPAKHGSRWITLTNPIDPAQELKLPFGARSQWLQPWRGYLDTPPARNVTDGLGINFNVPAQQAEASAAALERAGFHRARVEIGWNTIDPNNTSSLTPAFAAQERTILGALFRHHIRPLILLNSNDGIPTALKDITLHVMVPAAAGTRTLILSPALLAIVPVFAVARPEGRPVPAALGLSVVERWAGSRCDPSAKGSASTLAGDLGQHHTGCHRCVQRLGGPCHRDGHDGVAVLPDQPREPLALRTHHHDDGSGAVEVVELGVTLGVETDHLQARVGPILERAVQVGGTPHRHPGGRTGTGAPRHRGHRRGTPLRDQHPVPTERRHRTHDGAQVARI